MKAAMQAKLKYARAAVRSASIYATVTSAALFASFEVSAAQQAKDVMDNITENIHSAKIMVLTVVSLIGLFLFLWGIYLFHKNSQQPGQDHGKKGFVAIGVGIALLIAPFLIGVGAESLSSGQADAATQAIENDARF